MYRLQWVHSDPAPGRAEAAVLPYLQAVCQTLLVSLAADRGSCLVSEMWKITSCATAAAGSGGRGRHHGLEDVRPDALLDRHPVPGRVGAPRGESLVID